MSSTFELYKSILMNEVIIAYSYKRRVIRVTSLNYSKLSYNFYLANGKSIAVDRVSKYHAIRFGMVKKTAYNTIEYQLASNNLSPEANELLVLLGQKDKQNLSNEEAKLLLNYIAFKENKK